MVGYKLSNNDWVTPFFVIFRSVREILLVTVFLEHPVLVQVTVLLWKGSRIPIPSAWKNAVKRGFPS